MTHNEKQPALVGEPFAMRPLLVKISSLLVFCFLFNCSGDKPSPFLDTSSDSVPTSTEGDTETTPTDEDDSTESESVDTETSASTESNTEFQSDSDTTPSSDSDTEPVTGSQWWNCDYNQRWKVSILSVATMDEGQSIAIVLDHKSLVDSGRSQANGDDVRVVYWDGLIHRELPRILDPGSDWNRNDTKIWAGVPAPGISLTGEAQVTVYFANSKSPEPTAVEGDVFHFADFFARKNSQTVGNGWTIYQGNGTNIEIKDNNLLFSKTEDATNNPVADHSFDSLTERLRLRFGFDWSRTEIENHYRLHIQLGDSSAMEKTPINGEYDHFSNAGVGPSLVWSGPDQGMDAHEDLGYEVDGAISPLATISGLTDVQVEVDIPSQQYSVFTNGDSVGTDIQFSQDIDVIDTLRIFTWDIATNNFETRSFHYVILEKLGQTTPEINIVEAPSDEAYSHFCGAKE